MKEMKLCDSQNETCALMMPRHKTTVFKTAHVIKEIVFK